MIWPNLKSPKPPLALSVPLSRFMSLIRRGSALFVGGIEHPMFSYAKRRLWFWRFAHCWSIFKHRRRVVIAMIFLGILTAIVVTKLTRPIYTSQALVSDEAVQPNMDQMLRDAKIGNIH